MLDIVRIIANTQIRSKCFGFGGVSMAGNSNSGKSIPFRMSEKVLETKIK